MSRMPKYPVINSTPTERLRYQRWWIEDSGLSRDDLRRIASRIWPEEAARAWRRDSLVRAKSGA